MENKEDRLPGLGVLEGLEPKDEKPTRQRSAGRSPAGGSVWAPSQKEPVAAWSAMPARDACSRCGGPIHTVLCPPRQKCPATTGPLPTQGVSQDRRVPCPRLAFQLASMHADPWNSWTTEKPRMYPNTTPHPISGPGRRILNHIPHPKNGLLFYQETHSHSDFSSG